VLAGLSDVPRVPGPSPPPPSTPAGTCWNSAPAPKMTSCGSPATPGSGRPATSASAPPAPSRPSRRSPGGSPARTPPRTAPTSAATSTPPASTAKTSWTPCAAPSPGRRGGHRCRRPPDHNQRASPSASGMNVYRCPLRIFPRPGYAAHGTRHRPARCFPATAIPLVPEIFFFKLAPALTRRGTVRCRW
jgi:hypothetical protein